MAEGGFHGSSSISGAQGTDSGCHFGLGTSGQFEDVCQAPLVLAGACSYLCPAWGLGIVCNPPSSGLRPTHGNYAMGEEGAETSHTQNAPKLTVQVHKLLKIQSQIFRTTQNKNVL